MSWRTNCASLLPHLLQGSITTWRANCASFASLGALAKLQQLSLHAFHCPGAHLAAALMRLTALSELRLSGRVVLEPLAGLSRLTRLQVRWLLLLFVALRKTVFCCGRQVESSSPAQLCFDACAHLLLCWKLWILWLLASYSWALSGRVVLEPLAGLSKLRRLQVRYVLLILDRNRVPISCTDRQADVILSLAGPSRLARLLVCLLLTQVKQRQGCRCAADVHRVVCCLSSCCLAYTCVYGRPYCSAAALQYDIVLPLCLCCLSVASHVAAAGAGAHTRCTGGSSRCTMTYNAVMPC
jgi:hypothetical protein